MNEENLLTRSKFSSFEGDHLLFELLPGRIAKEYSETVGSRLATSSRRLIQGCILAICTVDII